MAPPRPARPALRLRWSRIAVGLTVTATLLSCLAVRHTGAIGASPAETPPAPPPRVVACPPLPQLVQSAPPALGASARTVALSFDDGPGDWTRPVLDVLDREHVLATFFVVGKAAQTRPDLLAAIAARGHLLGNHTWSHPTPGPAGWEESLLTPEIQRTEDLLEAATGARPCFFRPPTGATLGALPVTSRLGLSVALWSVDTRDWAQQPSHPGAPERIRQRAAAGLQQEHPVVLMHDGGGDRAATLTALPGIIADYRSHGYQFVRLDGGKEAGPAP